MCVSDQREPSWRLEVVGELFRPRFQQVEV